MISTPLRKLRGVFFLSYIFFSIISDILYESVYAGFIFQDADRTC